MFAIIDTICESSVFVFVYLSVYVCLCVCMCGCESVSASRRCNIELPIGEVSRRETNSWRGELSRLLRVDLRCRPVTAEFTASQSGHWQLHVYTVTGQLTSTRLSICVYYINILKHVITLGSRHTWTGQPLSTPRHLDPWAEFFSKVWLAWQKCGSIFG